ncbi:hypothetical protein LUZ60_001226 [Juncus effusus]|nr:hypothetical protein LUZ60_001226 [Juncus effusus]
MAPSYDCAASILLCAEDNNSLLGFDEENQDFDEIDCTVPGWIVGKRKDLFENFSVEFPVQSDECISLLVERELDHLPMGDYAERLSNGELDASVRRDAIDWIWKVHDHYSFGPLSFYLSVNYLDRFCSAYELPRDKAWMTQLLSVACLSLAAKMDETVIPLPLDLQVGDAKFVFEARTIQRMELLVLSTLNWKMQSVTPFSFIDYFLNKFNDGNIPSNLFISRSADLILRMIRGIYFLDFKPSEIAAAVALTVLEEIQCMEIEKSITTCFYLDKVRVLRCYSMIQEKVFMKSNVIKITGMVPASPNGIFEVSCLSHSSEENVTIGVLSCASRENNNSPSSKRRKISRLVH